MPTETPLFHPDSFPCRGVIVDMFPKLSIATRDRELPMLNELRSYLSTIDSILLVYHRKREKRLTKPDHIYIVHRTHVDADAFIKGWVFLDAKKFPKTLYAVQRTEDYSDMLLNQLQGELEESKLFMRRLDSGVRVPNRFRGPAFALLGPSVSESSPLPASLKDLSGDSFIDGASRRLVELEGELKAMKEALARAESKNDGRAGELMELEAKVRAYKF
ncbi:hypothetical protein FRC11_006749 [Ceratobasidium sp. 423]|nr:hypothetical protein FRC11_006749 [Ceratobasidium sp. 423]